MRSARRLAQHAQCGSGQTSQTTSASHPAKRPMLNAMSAERYMPQAIRKTWANSGKCPLGALRSARILSVSA